MKMIRILSLSLLFVTMLGLSSTLDNHIQAQNPDIEGSDNEKIVKEFYLSNDPAKIDQYLSDQFVSHMYSRSFDKKSYVEERQNFLNSFSNATVKIDQIISEGDTVAILSSWNFTQKTDLPGVQSGESIEFYLTDFFRVQDGKIVEGWGIPFPGTPIPRETNFNEGPT